MRMLVYSHILEYTYFYFTTPRSLPLLNTTKFLNNKSLSLMDRTRMPATNGGQHGVQEGRGRVQCCTGTRGQKGGKGRRGNQPELVLASALTTRPISASCTTPQLAHANHAPFFFGRARPDYNVVRVIPVVGRKYYERKDRYF